MTTNPVFGDIDDSESDSGYENEIIVAIKVKNEERSIRKCVVDAAYYNYITAGLVIYEAEHYACFIVKDDTKELLHTRGYKIIKFTPESPDTEFKQLVYGDKDSIDGFDITDDQFEELCKSLYGSRKQDMEPCDCCANFLWKVEVSNDINSVKKALRVILCHVNDRCIPAGVYHKEGRYYLVFNSATRNTFACLLGKGFKNIQLVKESPLGDRVQRVKSYLFKMGYKEFWDYVEFLIEKYDAVFEKNGRVECD